MVIFAPVKADTKPHLTARLVLELMNVESTVQRSSRSSHAAGESSPRPCSSENTASSAQHLQQLLMLAGCPGCSENYASESFSWSSRTDLTSSNDDSIRHDDSAESDDICSWKEDEEGEEFDFEEDRGRLCANVGAQDSSSRDESLLFALAGPERRNAHNSANSARAPSAWDELDHPLLTGGVAALHGYAASGANGVFLEKAYDLARDVAGSKHELNVAFTACRLALAAGYMHTLKKGSQKLARSFVLDHSLPKLVTSLEPYWTRAGHEGHTLAEELEWEESMLSLLEVTSSVSILADEKDIFSVLDDETSSGVTKSIGLYCVINPDILSQYPEVGRYCVRRYLGLLDADRQSQIAADLKRHVDIKSAHHRKREHKCLVGIE